MGHKRPTPQHLPAKLRAIRDTIGVSQYRLAKLLPAGRTRLSEFEWGRRMPGWFVLIRYARLAGVPLEFIVDDDIDLNYFKHYLTGVDRKRSELNQPEEHEGHRMVLFWRTSSTSEPKDDDKYLPCPGCGSPLEKEAVSGRYVCYDCDHEWEAWEVLDSLD